MWLKSNQKVVLGLFGIILALVALPLMPGKWFERMNTIQTYEEDSSAMGRINAWGFAINLAKDHPITGGGFATFTPDLFKIYAPFPEDFHDAHSIYFELLAEQGYVGLVLFLMIGFLAFKQCHYITSKCKGNYNLRWAANLAPMLQVSLIGYGVGGAFLGLAYFDLPYHLVALIVVTRSIIQRDINETDSHSRKSFSISTRSAISNRSDH
jgi:putative inorganic carbon (HCO3(-)) transporter